MQRTSKALIDDLQIVRHRESAALAANAPQRVNGRVTVGLLKNKPT